MKIQHVKNLNIGVRLGMGFGVLILLLAMSILVGMRELEHMNKTLHQVTEVNDVMVGAVDEMRISQLRDTVATSNVLLLADEAAKAEAELHVQTARRGYGEAAATLRKLMISAEDKAIMARIDASAAATRPLMDKARAFGRQNNTAMGVAVLEKEVRPAAAAWQGALADLMHKKEKENAAVTRENDEAYAQTRIFLFILGGVAVGLGYLIAWLATRSITGPIGEALAIARTVAAGDLCSQIEATTTDEAGQMIAALKTMNTNLHDIVGQVRQNTETMATASNQIASGNLDLSARTEEQASSLEETAASMEELTTAVKNNADNVRQANTLAVTASEVAKRGGQVVAQVVDTMTSISASSHKIVDIITVIDGIAFQTNILALNAAVEAARAGEQGRGFAVVASEVRNLAQRSASAAKEIKALIDDSVGRVADGTSLVTQAGMTMNDIVVSIKRVTDIMADISSAGREQEQGISQVNQAVIEMDAVTQQNAALVEEAAAAAESLQEQSATLMDLVSVFKLVQQNDSVKRTAAPARAPAVVPIKTVAQPAAAVRRSTPHNCARLGNVAEVESWEAF